MFELDTWARIHSVGVDVFCHLIQEHFDMMPMPHKNTLNTELVKRKLPTQNQWPQEIRNKRDKINNKKTTVLTTIQQQH